MAENLLAIGVHAALGQLSFFRLFDLARYDIIDIKYIIWRLRNGFTDTDPCGQRTKG